MIYQVHVKSFFDSNNDGIGDFPGLIAKLDYIADLGVNTIWLLPFYPSPQRDDGYDVANYEDVNPNYGTLDDFLAKLVFRAGDTIGAGDAIAVGLADGCLPSDQQAPLWEALGTQQFADAQGDPRLHFHHLPQWPGYKAGALNFALRQTDPSAEPPYLIGMACGFCHVGFNPLNPPAGCAFNPRCPQAMDRCRSERPDLLPAGATRAACWLHDAQVAA